MKAIIILGLLLSCLVSSSYAQQPTPLQPLQDVIIADLHAAAALAAANNYPAGADCMNALATEKLNSLVLPTKPGVFTLSMAAILTRRNLGQPIISDATAKACGPYARDVGAGIAQIAARVGLVVSPIKMPLF